MPELNSPELPRCLIQCEILPRLPIRSLGRFKCVCKEWNSFLSTRKFSKMHREVSHQKLLFLNREQHIFHSQYWEARKHGKSAIIYKADPDVVCILASLDGLVCLALKPTKLAFWNPLTGAYKKLSTNTDIVSLGPYNMQADAIAFYSDSSNDYKLLHIVSLKAAYIYSQRLDSWKKIEFLENIDYLCCLWSPATFFGHSIYFTAKKHMLCFDVNTEKFKVMQFPLIPKGSPYYCGKLVIRDGYICLPLAYRIDRNFRIVIDLWKIDVDGDRWVKVTGLPGEKLPSNGGIYITTTRNMEDLTSSDNWNLYRYERTIFAETLVAPNL